MPRNAGTGRPRVFVSYARNDQATARRLSEDLRDRGIDAFVDEQNIAPGSSFVLAVNRALAQSDYFVLLWSRDAAASPWVGEEWAAALVRDVEEQRSFLFVARLDRTPPPPMLAARTHLDAFHAGQGGWSDAVDKLVTIWRRDRAVGVTVLPAPRRMTSADTPSEPTVVLYIRNRSLSVAHLVVAPANSTGWELENLVRARLDLPECWEEFDGALLGRFSYQFTHAGRPIPAGETLAALGVTDDSTIDLAVQMRLEWADPDGSSPLAVNFMGPGGPNKAQIRKLVNSAFAHLLP